MLFKEFEGRQFQVMNGHHEHFNTILWRLYEASTRRRPKATSYSRSVYFKSERQI